MKKRSAAIAELKQNDHKPQVLIISLRELVDTTKALGTLKTAQLSNAFGLKVQILFILLISLQLSRILHFSAYFLSLVISACNHNPARVVSFVFCDPCDVQATQMTHPARATPCVDPFSFRFHLIYFALCLLLTRLHSVPQTTPYRHQFQSRFFLATNQNAPRLPLPPLPSFVGPKMPLTMR